MAKYISELSELSWIKSKLAYVKSGGGKESDLRRQREALLRIPATWQHVQEH